MKKITFFICFLLLTIFSNAQCPTGLTFLITQADIDNFATDYPGCTNPSSLVIRGSDITNLNGLSQITTIEGGLTIGGVQFGIQATDFSGLNNLTSIAGNLFVTDNLSLTSLAGLENLTFIGNNLSLGNNVVTDQGNPLLSDITALQNLETIGGSFFLYNHESLTNLDALSSVTTVGETIEIKDNLNLVSISGMSVGSIGGDYWIRNNPELVDLISIDGLGGSLHLFSNPLLQSLSGLENVQEASELSISFSDGLVDISALSNLTSIDTTIYIYDNDNLQNLNGLENILSAERLLLYFNDQLINIDALSNLDPNVMNTLQIIGNPSLSNCAILPVCQYLTTGNGIETEINSNASGCVDEGEIINECMNSPFFNNISGTLLFDETNNGCGTGDFPVAFIPVKTTAGSEVFTTYTNAQGDYSFFVDEGVYTTTSEVNNTIFNIDPSSQVSNFVGIGQSDISDFCVTAINVADDVSVTIIPTRPARPGFEAEYELVFQNKGTTTTSGEVTLAFNSSKMTFLMSDPIPDMVLPNLLSWDYTNLSPFESRTIQLEFDVFVPPIVEIGDLNILTANITPVGSDINPDDNTFTLEQIVVGSFDPNDKNVLEGERVHIDDIDKYLHYLIRFQNTGTAAAINVRVNDVLSDKLDLTTFEPLSFSHEVRIQSLNNQYQFRFDNINLPDSTSNEPESHGHILFRIKPKNNVVVGDIIDGSAAIYFDFNPPIITNTVATEIVDNEAPIALDDTFEVDEASNMSFSIIANDTDDNGLDLSSIVFTELPLSGNVIDNGDGTVTYTHDDVEVLVTEQDYIRYTIADTDGLVSNVAVITVEIQPVNDAPVAENDTLVVNQGDDGTIAVVLNDFDVDGTLDLATITVVSEPLFGEVVDNGDGTLTYSHDGSSNFVDNFEYEIDDDLGETSNIATVAITIDEVLGINDLSDVDLLLYPNPVKDILSIRGNFERILIYNVLGQLIHESEASIIDVSDLESGLYFAASKEGQKTKVQMFIKE